jgi:hypothetical protein
MDQQRPRQQSPSLWFLGSALLVMAFNGWYYVDFQTQHDGRHRMRSVDTVEDATTPLTSVGGDVEIAMLLSFPNSVSVT